MEKILRVFFVLLVAGLMVYGLWGMDLGQLLRGVGQQRVYIQRDEEATFLPDWNEEDLLKKINDKRLSLGLSAIKMNEKLSKFAKARLAVILENGDIDGEVTGISREAVLKLAEYSASLVGDLVVSDFYKTNEPVSFWESNEISKETLLHPDFSELGLAIKNRDDKVDVYVLLVSPRKSAPKTSKSSTSWGGPELWTAVNKRRVEMGVNPLKVKDELCTLASIRLNQLLDLGKLDGHAGFEPTLARNDLKHIKEEYTVSEFLIQGYESPTAAVSAWENTLGHRVLLAGGEYVWGCVYAQNTFGVAIAAY